MLSIELIDAKVGYIGTVGNGQSGNAQQSASNGQSNTQRGAPPAQRPAPQPQQNVASKMYGNNPQPQQQNITPDLDEGWDSDIPF